VARIPEAELERLKAEVSLQRLAEAKGVELKRHGADLLGRCPFHDDRTPSLVISPKKNLWHCLGACQAGGSVVDWVMRSEGVSFRHAVELLRADLPLTAGPPPKVGTVRRLPAPVATDAEDREALRQVVEYYHATLKQSPEALDYLDRRGLRHPELVERFQLGFANRTLGLRLPQGNRKAGADVRSRLQQLGVIRASGHEHFNGSLVVPVFDAAGQVVEMYGRKVTPNLRTGTPDHLYLPGPHRGAWNEEGISAADGEVILCEALLDAMSLWVAGFRNVTAAYGVEGFGDDHLDAFRRHGVHRVLIAYDRDAAGDKAAVLLAVKLTAAGIDCFRVQLPQGEDANSLLLQDVPSAQQRFARLLRKAVWLGQGKPPPDTPKPAPVPMATEDGAAKEEEVEPTPPLVAAAPPAPMRAGPVPPAPGDGPPLEEHGAEVVMRFGERRWRVRGLEKNLSYDLLRVNLLVSKGGGADGAEAFHVDTLDLYSARARTLFTKQAADELGVQEEALKRDLGRLLLKLEGLAEERIQRALEPKQTQVNISEEETAEAMELLRDPRLLARILEDFDHMGVVGERTAKLAGYLAATSRKLEQPLAVVVQSSSAAGKSALLEAVLAMVPEEERVKYSAMTGQSLYYMGEQDLEHKVLALVEEEGAERAAYALKLLQSEGELSIASTGKDPQSGRLVTHEYRVKGPVSIFLTTTAIDVDEELLNRCLVLAVDEGREQTRAIHARQRHRQTLEGLLEDKERERLLRLHRNAQRLLKPLLVVNPYAERLTFCDERTRTRRDHLKYLTLIRTVALLHQHQRELRETQWRGQRVAYVEVTPADIRVANELAHEVLGRSLDELPPQTRRLLLLLDEMVRARMEELDLERAEVRFSRKQVRAETGWGDTQLRIHLARLTELEHLLIHRGGRGQSFVYELLWDGAGAGGAPHLSGLIDPDDLDVRAYDANPAGETAEVAGGSRAERGVVAALPRSPRPISSPTDADDEDVDVHVSGEERSRVVEVRRAASA